MERMFSNLLLIIFYVGLCNSHGFIADQKCLYRDLGASSNFNITPHVDFYIPHNWIKNNHKLNYLHIKLFSRDLVLRHPSSSNKGSNEINLPYEKLKIGWNRIYLKRDGNIMQVIVRPVEDNSIKVIQIFTIQPTITFPGHEDTLHATGLHSLVECHKDLNTRYYKIPARTSVKIPYVMFKQVDRFDAYSETHPFSFEISLFGKRQKICKEEIRDQPDVYSVPKECRHWPVNEFSQDTVYNVYMYPASYNAKDILKYKDFTFTEFELHNIGDTDFYIRTFIKPESNAPISLLKELPASDVTVTVTPPISPAEQPGSDVIPVEPPVIVPVPPGQKGCGINMKKTSSNRISGGATTKPNDWPWMAALVQSEGFGEPETLICGGVLITDRHVLTSANCFSGVNQEDFKVRLGEFDFSTYDEHHVDFTIGEVITPDNFIPDENEHDIAIIKLNGSTGERFQPVCLPPPNQDFEDQYGFITGWGKVFILGAESSHLREALVQIWKQSECQAVYPKSSITNNMMCSGSRGGIGSCEGDTGGPLVVQILPETQWYVVGIDSWGTGCGINDLPTVYTKVDQYLDWIAKNTAL